MGRLFRLDGKGALLAAEEEFAADVAAPTFLILFRIMNDCMVWAKVMMVSTTRKMVTALLPCRDGNGASNGYACVIKFNE